MPEVTNAKLIGLDWGTTSFRAFLINEDGLILDKKTSKNGILSVVDKDFEGTLLNEINLWLEQNESLPIIASGMITSRNGWLETPYLNLPSNIDGFAGALTHFKISNGLFIHFITGASYEDSKGIPDIMRGEETQIIGSLDNNNDDIFLLPGTHSKWAKTEDENILSFASFMTGEVYAALKDHTILGALMENEDQSNEYAFSNGVEDRLKENVSIMHQIFTARTLPLFDRMKNSEIADYLSGLLIGEEIKSALNQYDVSNDNIVNIIGRGDLAARYAKALDIFDIKYKIIGDDVTAMGHYKIAMKAGLVK